MFEIRLINTETPLEVYYSYNSLLVPTTNDTILIEHIEKQERVLFKVVERVINSSLNNNVVLLYGHIL